MDRLEHEAVAAECDDDVGIRGRFGWIDRFERFARGLTLRSARCNERDVLGLRVRL